MSESEQSLKSTPFGVELLPALAGRGTACVPEFDYAEPTTTDLDDCPRVPARGRPRPAGRRSVASPGRLGLSPGRTAAAGRGGHSPGGVAPARVRRFSRPGAG